MQTVPLIHRVDSAIRNSPHVIRRRVYLENNAGRLILRGRVDSYYEKQMVQELVRRVEGIEEIHNHIEVEEYSR